MADPITPSGVLGANANSAANTSENCRTCGQPVSVPEFLIRFSRFGVLCPTCAEAARIEATIKEFEASKLARSLRWQKFCPAGFLDTVPSKLPNQAKLSRVLEWSYGPRGLVLYGASGRGKSRCAWVLLNREFEAGKTIRVISHDIGFTYAAKFGESAEMAARWIESLSTADILLIDDVFKGKLTDSLEAAIFTVISAHTENGKPIIITCNDVGNTLASRMSPDRGIAMVRRIREFCEPIQF